MKALDFFCGAGGLTRGLLDAGIEVVAGIDADSNCADTHARNNPGAKFLHHDIATLDDTALQKLIERINPNDLLIAGCAPCQPFSKQRKPEQANTKNRLRRKSDSKLLGDRPAALLAIQGALTLFRRSASPSSPAPGAELEELNTPALCSSRIPRTSQPP